MKTKSFQKYLEKRLNKKEIADIEKQARREVEILRALKQLISSTLSSYMAEKNISFNELVRRLNSTPSHISKIQKGEANLTLSSVAHIFALLDKDPQEIFKINS